MGGGKLKAMWFWCPKCKEAVPQLSPSHLKGECHCEMRQTKKHVEMILVPEDDKRVAPFVQEIQRDLREEKIYLHSFHMRVHLGRVQLYVRRDGLKEDGYLMGVEMKDGHSEFAINQATYMAFRDNAYENRVKMKFACPDNPKCPGHDKEFRRAL